MAEQIQEYVRASKAAELLGVSRVKMARMLSKGQLPHERDPFDGRVKLIPLFAIRAYQEQRAQRRVVDPKSLVA